MKTNNTKIIPCICCENTNDSGLPQLQVTSSDIHTYYTAYCPNCGRGGIFQFKSERSAIKNWNEMQTDLRTPLKIIPVSTTETVT